MSADTSVVEQTVRLPKEHADRLRDLAQHQRLSEDEVIAKALDILFSLQHVFDPAAERSDWSSLSDESLARVWDNEQDAAYDDWRELYGVPAR